MESKCYVVNHRCYSGDNYSVVYWKEEHAKECIQNDLKIIEKEMQIGMYDYDVLDRLDSIELYVVDSDIYYEWEIVETTIE